MNKLLKQIFPSSWPEQDEPLEWLLWWAARVAGDPAKWRNHEEWRDMLLRELETILKDVRGNQ